VLNRVGAFVAVGLLGTLAYIALLPPHRAVALGDMAYSTPCASQSRDLPLQELHARASVLNAQLNDLEVRVTDQTAHIHVDWMFEVRSRSAATWTSCSLSTEPRRRHS